MDWCGVLGSLSTIISCYLADTDFGVVLRTRSSLSEQDRRHQTELELGGGCCPE
jgi:hypothetical protein